MSWRWVSGVGALIELDQLSNTVQSNPIKAPTDQKMKNNKLMLLVSVSFCVAACGVVCVWYLILSIMLCLSANLMCISWSDMDLMWSHHMSPWAKCKSHGSSSRNKSGGTVTPACLWWAPNSLSADHSKCRSPADNCAFQNTIAFDLSQQTHLRDSSLLAWRSAPS